MKNIKPIFILLIFGCMLFVFQIDIYASKNKSENFEEHNIERWTCSMHPQIKLLEKGKCPICGMALVLVDKKADNFDMNSDRMLRLSKYAAALAEVEVHPVERKFVDKRIDLLGEIDFDESRTSYITAWVDGRIDRLYVDETGVAVREGEHIAEIYSPGLLSTQQEYLQAIKGAEDVNASHLDIVRSSSKETVKNARDKLLLLGLKEEQIALLEKQAKLSNNITIFSKLNGVVLKREVQEGDYVKTGQRLYEISDLDYLWVWLDAYESDIKWLRYGQVANFEVDAYPGEFFEGRIVFISPVLDKITRTVKVRLTVENNNAKLKPGMFVRAFVKSVATENGNVVDDYLKDKWLCSMHPAIIQNEAGICSVCKMPLVSALSMGYVDTASSEPPLVVKASAVLRTGKRAVVYVKVSATDDAEDVFEGREILLGSRAGDYYVVVEGLKEGELVVTKGNFKIDSALQIQAKPSMMSLMETDLIKEDFSDQFRLQLNDFYEIYFKFQDFLANDNFVETKKMAEKVQIKLAAIDTTFLKKAFLSKWDKLEKRLSVALYNFNKTQLNDIKLRQTSFKEIADIVLEIRQIFGNAGRGEYYEAFCPMALNDAGGSWLQRDDVINNPFFGKTMKGCGVVKKTFSGDSEI